MLATAPTPIVRYLLIVTFCCLIGAVPAHAADLDTARDYTTPALDRTQYQQFCRALNATSDQQLILDFTYEDYREQLDALMAEADAAAVAAGRDDLEKFYSGRARLDRAEVTAIRVDVLRAYESIWPQADVLFERIVQNTLAVVTETPDARRKQAMRALRRRVLLHPQHDSHTAPTYAGSGVDLLLLIERARQDGAELSTIDEAQLAPITAAYERDLDAQLQQAFNAQRAGRVDLLIADIQGDENARSDIETASIERWRSIYDLNVSTVDRVAAVAEQHVNAAAADAFRDRFDRASFGWLHRPRRADQQFEWIMGEQLDDATRAAARDVYTTYRAAHDPLTRRAMQITLDARRDDGVILSASMLNPNRLMGTSAYDAYQQLLRITGEQTAIETAASQQLTALLSADQKKRMQRELRRRR